MARVAERVAGVPLWDYAAEHVFGPLGVRRGLSHTPLAHGHVPRQIHDMAFRIQEHTQEKLVGLHERRPDGTLHLRGASRGLQAPDPNARAGHLPGPLYSLANVGAGTLGAYGTVPDYLKLLTVYMNDGVGANGHRLLSPAIAREALRDQLVELGIAMPDTMYSSNKQFSLDVAFGDGCVGVSVNGAVTESSCARSRTGWVRC